MSTRDDRKQDFLEHVLLADDTLGYFLAQLDSGSKQLFPTGICGRRRGYVNCGHAYLVLR